MTDDISAFTKMANNCPVLSPQEEDRLLELAQKTPPVPGTAAAWTKLVKHNVRYVITIAKRNLNKGLEFQDLIQEGLCGLVTAIEKFDRSRKFKLSTYATWWIRQSITRAIHNLGRAIRIPINKQNEIYIINRYYRMFCERVGHPPDSEELSLIICKAAEVELERQRIETKKTGKPAKKKNLKALSKEDVELLGRMVHPQVSLDDPQSEDENLTMLDYLPGSDTDQPDLLAEDSDNKSKLYQALNFVLSEEERLLVMWKFGLLDGKEKNRKELASYKRLPEQEAQKRLDAILLKLGNVLKREEFSLD